MPSLSIHVPFVRGQNEQVDRKLLPEGHFRAVYNMHLERDGRMARRPRLVQKSLVQANGEAISETPLGGAEPSALIVNTDDKKTSVAKWALGTSGVEQLRVATGELGCITRVETFYSPHENVAVDTAYDFSEDDSDAYGKQLFPQVDIDSEGRIVFAQRQGSHIVITVREPEKLAILFEIRKYYSIGSAGDLFRFKMVASKMSNRIAIIAAFTIPELPAAQVDVNLFDSATGEELDANGGLPLLSQGILATTGFGLDAMARPDVDTFMLAYDTTTAGTFKLSEYSFQDGTLVEEHDEMTGGTPYNWGPVFSLHVGAQDERWAWGVSGVADAGPILRAKTWGGAEVQQKEFTADDMVPGIVALDAGRTAVLVGALEDDALLGTASGFTKVVIWDHSDNSTTRLGNDNQVGGGGWMHHLYAGHPITVGEGDSARIMFAAYSAGPYFQRKEEPSCGWVNSVSVADEELIVEAKIMEAGLEYRLWEGKTASIAFGESEWLRGYLYEVAPARPLRYSHGGEDYIIWPLMQVNPARNSFGATTQEEPRPLATWHRTRVGGARGGITIRGGETIIPGGALRVFDGSGTLLAGYMAAPGITFGVQELDDAFGDGLTPNKTTLFAAVLEFIDGNGRLWRSAPSPIQSVELGTPTESFIFGWKFWLQAPTGQAGQNRGSQVVVYMSEEDGTVLYRRWSFAIENGFTYDYDGPDVDAGFYITGSIDDTILNGAETLYTQSGEVANDPPPCCEMVTATRSRIWAAGLPSKNWIQASKTLRDTMGIEWSNLDSFKIFMPDEVTGLAAMDDSVVAFTRSGVYVIGGEGPDLTGVGTFFEPQYVPSSSGCIEHRSVISTEVGVFYQSKRGLEIVPRGFGSPVWVGEPVRDTLAAFPRCKGACISPVDYTVRWLFNRADDSESVVVVYDLRAKGWYVYGYGRAFDGISRCVGRDGDSGHEAMMLIGGGEVFVEDLAPGSVEALVEHDAYLETGDMRFSAIQGWASGRRVHLLGQFGGRACTVKLDFAFDGQRYLPQDTFSWAVTEDEYGADVPVELQLTLPVQLFSSVRFKITVLSGDDTESSAYSYKPNGLTLYYTPHAEGPRLESRKTG